jgi:integrase
MCRSAGIKVKTAHCLRVTCATALFQHGVDEKLIQDRTGHSSNALFKYEKASKEQVTTVSRILHSKKRCVNLTHLFVQILTHL